MKYYGFVYCWINCKNGKKYIGSHHGTVDDGYIGSGIYFNRAYEKCPENFKREILEYNIIADNPYITYTLEQKYLDQILDIHLNEQYYNLTPNAFAPGGWNKGLTKETDERVARQSIGLKGKAGWNKGLTKETDTRIKQKSINSKGSIPWNKNTKGLAFHTEETKQKISLAVIARHKSGSMKAAYQKIAKTKTGKNKENDNGRRITSEKMKGNQNSANRKNTPKGKIWIHKENKCKMIYPNEIDKYTTWKKGRK